VHRTDAPQWVKNLAPFPASNQLLGRNRDRHKHHVSNIGLGENGEEPVEIEAPQQPSKPR